MITVNAAAVADVAPRAVSKSYVAIYAFAAVAVGLLVRLMLLYMLLQQLLLKLLLWVLLL